MFDLSFCAQLSLSLCYPCWGSTKGVMLQSLWKDREEIGEPAKGQGSLRPWEVSVARDSHLHPCPALPCPILAYVMMHMCKHRQTNIRMHTHMHICTQTCTGTFPGCCILPWTRLFCRYFLWIGIFISSQGRSVYPLGLNVTYLGIDLRCKGFFWLNELSWFE